jgi:class 3 adenylate cyclase/tetratricopeptide (TPR) repeat protein
MSRICPACGAEGADDARFCSACATPLGAVPAGRKERKLATALFADLVGSTALTEGEDPEVVESLVGHAFDEAAAEIERHGGLIEKFVGDAILAVFGLPSVHEDDPERAVRAAIAIQARLGELNRRSARAGKPPLAMRIGIEAGEVLVDIQRAAGPRHRMITGDAVNTAARLEQAALPGRVLVGPAVYDATRETVEYRPLAPLQLKGKARPVPAWEALGHRAAGPGQRAPLRLQARLVGRRHELARLEDALALVRVEGRPRLVTVLGPGGIGKTRLTHEFLRLAEDRLERVAVRKGHCLSYGNVSYSALAEIMRTECGILDDDPSDVASAKVSSTLERLFGDRELTAHLEALIGSGPQHRFGREDLFDAWRRILERLAGPAPLILVLEDLHWADDGLLDFVDHVATWAHAPILLLALARPELLERRPDWRDGAANTTVVLGSLTDQETAALLEDLQAAPLPAELLRAVLESGEGNPLFCEEIVRMLADRGVARAGRDGETEPTGSGEALKMPRTIQALLSARLDALAGEEKALLQDAAVVGRTFWAGALGRLSDIDESRVLTILDGLRARGFIELREPSTLSGVPEYAFHHVLVRDVAYESLPKTMRALKHAATAHWAEEQAGDRSPEIAELLATHHVQALRWLDELGETDGEREGIERDAYRWTRMAGERAGRLWEQREAVRWLRTALDLGARVGGGDDELAPLWEAYARASEGLASVPDVVAGWQEAQRRYLRAGDAAGVGRVEASIALVSTWAEQGTETRRLAEQAIARLEPLGESADLAFALYVLGRHHLERSELDRAEPLLRRAEVIAGRMGAQATEANANISLGWTLHARRRGDETIRLLDRALVIARSAGDLSLLLDALEAVLSAAVEVSGDYARAEELGREAIEVAQRAGNLLKLARAQLNLAYLLREVGRLDELAAPLRAARDAATAVGDERDLAWTNGVAALADVTRGDVVAAREGIRAFRALQGRVDVEAVAYVEEIGGIAEAYVAMAEGRDSEAAAILVDAQCRVPDDRLSVWFGQTLLFEAVRAALRAGRVGDARAARDRLEHLGLGDTPPRAFLAWADGLLEPDPARASGLLEEAAARLETLDRRIDLGRCLLDLAIARERLGLEARLAAERGRRILESCGARLFLAS